MIERERERGRTRINKCSAKYKLATTAAEGRMGRELTKTSIARRVIEEGDGGWGAITD